MIRKRRHERWRDNAGGDGCGGLMGHGRIVVRTHGAWQDSGVETAGIEG
jgi:hypothetical protein